MQSMSVELSRTDAT